MNENKQEILQKKKEEYEKSAQEAFNSILAAYRLVVDQINNEHFEAVNKAMSKQTNKNIEGIGNAFKEHLFSTIKETFTKAWKDFDMDCNVAMLEMAKKNLTTDQKWRPSDKTADEQLRPHVVRMLEKEKDFLRMQIEAQKEKIARYIPIVEENRRLMAEKIACQAESVNTLNKEIDKVEENLEKVHDVIGRLEKFQD